MKILNYKILNESIIDDLIKTDQLQSSLLSKLPHNPNKHHTTNKESLDGKYDITFNIKGKETSGVFDVHVIDKHNKLILKNGKLKTKNRFSGPNDVINIKLHKPFDDIDELIGKTLVADFIKGNWYDLLNTTITFNKFEKI